MLLRLYRLIALTISCYLLASCAMTGKTDNGNFIVLNYQDFGPQAMAEELLGPEYWQWDSGQYSQPQKFDIKVVVYRNMNLDVVKLTFPVNKNQKKDFRYVEYKVAMQWYDRQIDSFNADLTSNSGDKDISFYFLRNLYANSLKIERTLRR
jgi:hypothetical protein